MIPRRSFAANIAMFVFVLSLVQIGRAQQPENSLVKPEGATQYEITNLDNEVTIRVPVTLQSGAKVVTPSVLSVAIGKRSDQAVAKLFSSEMESRPGDSTQVLLIKVKAQTLEQGTYSVLIDFQGASQSVPAKPAKPAKKATRPDQQTSKHQFLKIEIVLPEAKLATLDPVVIEQVLYLFCTSATPGPPVLSLTEISGHRTRLNDVRINQTEIPTGTNEPTQQTVDFAPLSAIGPMDTARSAMMLSGAFPLGTTKGKALISSPQLSAPVPLSFEVRTHLWRGFIVVIVVLGLALGFLARVWTKHRIELQEARLQAIKVLDTLRQEFGRRPDAIFRDELTAAMAVLRAAINAPAGAGDLANAINTASGQLSTALQNLDRRRAVAQTTLDTLKKVDHIKASLPVNIATVVELDATLSKGIAHDIESDNVAAAQNSLNGRITVIGDALGPMIQEWLGHTRTFLEQAADLAAFLPPNLSAGITQEATAIIAKLVELPPIDDPASVDAVLAIVSSIRELRLTINGFVRRLGEVLSSSTSAVRIQFKVAAVEIESSLAAVDRLTQHLPEWAKHPETETQEMQASIATAKTSLRIALLNQLQGDDAAVVAEVTTVTGFLDQNQLWSAALSVAQFLQAHPADTLLGEETAHGMQPAIPFAFEPTTPEWMIPEIVTSFSIVREKTIQPTVESLQVSTMRDLILLKGIRWIIASIGIVAVGYALFSSKFVGTFPDLLAIFVWAFGVDISVDALLDAGKKLKPA